jgi:HAD superfamily hydrolase (TIGR01509 family)
MIKALITDISKVLLFSKDESYTGSLNDLYHKNKDSDDFVFDSYFRFNDEFLEFYKLLKDKLDVYILTSETIQDAPEMQRYWEGAISEIFSASKMGTHKSKPEAHEMVLKKINLKPEEAIYVDDDIKNIEAAKSVGLDTVWYKNNEDAMSEINKLL